MTLLSGIRVVDMGLWVAGPAAGGILADWGADVIKVEMLSGDPMRKLFGALSGSKEARCPPFDLYNRGKRSVAVDVNDPEGARLVHSIVAGADVFLTNMRPQFLKRVALDHTALLAQHPRLVYGSLTGYGLDGPDKDAPGFDIAAFSARSGLAHRATPAGAPSPILPGGMGDNVTAMALVAGVMGALLARERTGHGQLVSTSLLRAGIYSIGMDVSTRVSLGRIGATPSRTRPQNPLMNPYRAGDDRWFWLIGAEAERHWPTILKALGAPALGTDERYGTPRDRRRNGEALVADLDRIFATKSRAEWAAIFVENGVWWAPVNTVDDLLEDPQVLASGAFVPEPGAEGENAPQSVSSPVDFGASRSHATTPPPQIGQHTDAVLREAGVADTDLVRLRAAGVIA
jgi:crotonobetainyl-CoA:carnitine CoA-transferase CaiB-like acyl-CoA transferase